MSTDPNPYLDSSAGRIDQLACFLDDIAAKPCIVEFGPGSGHTLRQIETLLKGATLYGFDIYPSYVSEEIRIMQADLNCFDFSNHRELLSRADGILLLDVLEHLVAPLTFLEKLDNHLSGCVHVAVSCPNFGSVRMLSAWIKGSLPRTDIGFFDKTHLHWLSAHDLVAFFSPKGYRSIRVKYVFSRHPFVRLIQRALPSRLCSQFMVFLVK